MKTFPVLWLTGLSGAGKSTIADALALRAKAAGLRVEVLDGDSIRAITSNQNFSKEERNKNVKTVGLLAHFLQRQGTLVIVAMISPYRESRDFSRDLCHPFCEVHVATSLEECERRDVKGLYKRARSGEIPQFTGIDDPYEPPLRPEFQFDTTRISRDEIVEHLWSDAVQAGSIDASSKT